jgi:hypothetical protein
MVSTQTAFGVRSAMHLSAVAWKDHLVTTAREFVEAFVGRFPTLRPLHEEHLRDNGELLPHAIFGIGEGFTDRIVDAYQRHGADALD